jgi:hypothetical protein
VFVKPLELLEGGALLLILIKHVVPRKIRNFPFDEPVEFPQTGGDLICVEESRDGKKAVSQKALADT